ncbi:MAG TPA: hypothetical protein VLI04_02350 [Nocardioidaceae bacterium]|nr:hypothetical protein [Nocardioidaceae bacterium]
MILRSAALAATLSLVAGCGSDAEPQPKDLQPTDTSGQQVVVDSLGLTFHVPDGWVIFEASSPPEASDATVRALAKRLKVKATLLTTRIRSGAMVQLYSDQPAPRGLVDSATVIGLLIDELPNKEILRVQLEKAGGTEVQLSDAETAAGPAIVVSYQLTGHSSTVVFGQAAYVDVGRTVAVLTVSSTKAEQTATLGQLVLDSVDLDS